MKCHKCNYLFSIQKETYYIKVKGKKGETKYEKVDIMPHQCDYMMALWSASLRGMECLKIMKETFDKKPLNAEAKAIIFFTLNIIKNIVYSFPFFLNSDDQEIYDWASNYIIDQNIKKE